MSKLKTPREKKDASLLKDSRNVYGENDKASRKLIPLARQAGHQNARRSVDEVLRTIQGVMEVDEIDAVESEARAREIAGKRNLFVKTADAPLAGVLRERSSPSSPTWEGADRWYAYRERFAKRKSKA